MVFSETDSGADIQINKSEEELKFELTAINQERCDHCKALENQWPNIPPEAIHCLAQNCPTPELMSLALTELQRVGTKNPEMLSDPDLIQIVVSDSVSIARQKLANEGEQIVAEFNDEKTTTKALLLKINYETSHLKGRAKLDAAIAYLDSPDIPQTVREELSSRFNRIGKTLDEMSAVFTDEASQAAFQSIVNTASFDLGAPNMATTFAPVLEQVETSASFSDDQKIRLRQIVTGSDAQDVLRETISDENGITRPRYSQKHQRELRQGVSGYVEGHNRQMIEARAGSHIVTKDVTGWSGEDVGFLIEATHMWNMYDSFGVTGFIEDVYKIDFSILGDGNAFDPIQIMHLRQVLSFLTGSFEGYDGDIANLTEHKTLIQNQSRLMSDMQTAFGWENDRSGTTRTLRRLGLEDKDGHPDMDIIKAFGDYTREHYATGAVNQAGLTDYLHKYFPNKVRPLSDAKRASVNFKV